MLIKADLSLIFLLCSMLILIDSVTMTGHFSPFSSTYNIHGPYTFYGFAWADTIDIQLNITSASSVPQLLMQVGFDNSPPDPYILDISNYQDLDPTQALTFDLSHANAGQKQVVNLGELQTGDILYILVINFNLQGSTRYTLNITERVGYNYSNCLNGNNMYNNTIYCSSCWTALYTGSFCDIANIIVPSNINYSFTLAGTNDTRGSNFVTLTIPATSGQINLVYQASKNNTVVAYQFKSFSSDVAGIINYAEGGLYTINQNTTTGYNISIQTFGNDTSVSFLNLNPTSVSIAIFYTVQSSSGGANILIIVLALLGTILFIGLVIVVFCLVKRMQNPQPQVQSISYMHESVVEGYSIHLSLYEIQAFFPAVPFKRVINNLKEEPSQNALSCEKEKIYDRDCVICLCAIQKTDMVKVAFCRHTFHAQCLNKWFDKQRNCPYCRQDYSRKATLEHYQTLLRHTHRTMLGGIDLARQIMQSKHINSHLVVEEIVD